MSRYNTNYTDKKQTHPDSRIRKIPLGIHLDKELASFGHICLKRKQLTPRLTSIIVSFKKVTTINDK